MTNKIEMQLSKPLLLGACSLALLSIGAGIGAHWGHYPHVAVWMVVLGAVLMIAHDTGTARLLLHSAYECAAPSSAFRAGDRAASVAQQT
jgi:hypothetical protein